MRLQLGLLKSMTVKSHYKGTLYVQRYPLILVVNIVVIMCHLTALLSYLPACN